MNLEQLKICLQEQVSDDEFKRAQEYKEIMAFYDWVFENSDDACEIEGRRHLSALSHHAKDFPLIFSFARMFIG